MAIREFTNVNPPTIGRSSGGVLVISWTGLLNGDYGRRVSVPALADRSVQMLGTLGTGGTATIYGSNKLDPDESADTDWAVLNDPQANALALNAFKIESIMEPTLWIRPKITAGDGTTALQLYLLLLGK